MNFADESYYIAFFLAGNRATPDELDAIEEIRTLPLEAGRYTLSIVSASMAGTLLIAPDYVAGTIPDAYANEHNRCHGKTNEPPRTVQAGNSRYSRNPPNSACHGRKQDRRVGAVVRAQPHGQQRGQTDGGCCSNNRRGVVHACPQ